MHLMAQDLKTMLFQKWMIIYLFFFIWKFDKIMAADTLGMMMGLLIINMFKMTVFIPKGCFSDDTRLQ